MSKENENINLFVIEEDYRRRKTNQNCNDYCSGKAVAPILTESVIEKFEEMHLDFESAKDSEQTESPQFAESSDYPDSQDLLESFQKVNAEELKLLEIKQNLLKTQKDLQNSLVNEIDKKKKTIANLTIEISILQKTCGQLSRALGIPHSESLT